VNEGYSHTAAVLTDVKNHAGVLDPTCSMLMAPDLQAHGWRRAGLRSEFADARGTSDNIAVYASDEWQITDKLRLDGGMRWEHIRTSGEVEGTRKANLNQSPTPADDSVGVGNGVFTPFSRKYDHAAWTIGANYQYIPESGVFVRYTDTFRLLRFQFHHQRRRFAGCADDEYGRSGRQVFPA